MSSDERAGVENTYDLRKYDEQSLVIRDRILHPAHYLTIDYN